ncbi:MAG: M3 family oligoendopeptidase [Alphaproteobacteria bacterium]|nr:M3 family oligoendopeptidase [Alphaproteobacteria bacterium]
MATATNLGTLPTWDLGDLYPAPDSPALAADLSAAATAAKDFAAAHAGRLAVMTGAELGAAIAAYEVQQERLGRIGSFAYLVFCRAMDDAEVGRFYQTTQEAVNDITTNLLFFTLEMNKLDDAVLEAKLADPAAARYRPWLRDVRAFRPYQLSEELEKLLHEKAVTGRDAWVRLFDETVTALRFSVGGKELGEAEALDLFHSPDGAVRREAAHEIGRVLGRNLRGFATIMNTLVKDKEIEDRWRGFQHPMASRNVANQVEDAVVDALMAAVRDSYPRLSHRYYALKAKWFGGDRLDYWDRNAPLPDEDAGTIPWSTAVTTVLDAYDAFSPELRRAAEPFFAKPWIDAGSKPGKTGGAFAHPTVPSAHPYLLLNYQGRAHDVMTLAHELGHGVHQVLAAGQGALMADTPLTLAETASVFGEQLTFRRLLAGERDRGRRRVLLARKVEDMLNTVVRQIAFCDFERRLHDERRTGELTAERIGELWMSVQGESLGPALRFDAAYHVYWTYIPHFVHTPFYVYAYAFGDCLVNALYAVYEDAADGFQERYLRMLRAGGTLRHRELLAPFGLDAGDPAFWSKGLGLIARFIDELDET